MAEQNLENTALDLSSFQEINYDGGPGEKPKPKESGSGSGLAVPTFNKGSFNGLNKDSKKRLSSLAKKVNSDPVAKQRNQEILQNMRYKEQTKKLDRLTEDQSQVLQALLKQNNLDPSQAASYSNDSVKEYIDASLKLNYFDSKNEAKQNEKKSLARAEKEEGFFNWENWKANVQYSADWVKEAITPNYKGTIVGKGSGVKKEHYESTKNKMRKFEEPIIAEVHKKQSQNTALIDSKLKQNEQRKSQLIGQADPSKIQVDTFFYSNLTPEEKAKKDEILKLDIERNRLMKARQSSLNKQEQLEAYLKNDGPGADLWAGLNNVDYSRIIGTGVDTAVQTYRVKQKQVKAEADGPPLSEADQIYLNELAQTDKFNATTKQTIDRDRFLTRTGEGTGESGVFMGQILVTAPAGGVAGAAVKSLVSPLAAKVAMSTAIKSAGMVEGRLATKALEQLATKGIGHIENGMVRSADLFAQGAAMPSTYENAAKKFIGQTSIVTDKDGNEKLLLTASAKKAFEKQTKNSLAILNAEEKYLTSKKELTEAEQDRLSQISLEKNEINENLNSIYQVRTGKDGKDEYYIPDDISGEDALMYGYSETMKELLAERYVGALGKPIAKLANRIPGMKGTINSPIGNAVDRFWSRGQNLVNNSKLGLVSSNLAYHTGGSKIFHNLPGEVLEEIAVQLTPTYMEDYSKQFEELSNPQFYVDVIAQTLLMGAGFGSVATGKHLGSYTFNKAYRDNIRDIRSTKRELSEIYKNIDKAVTDNDLAVSIGMNTGDTSFNIQDYQAKVAELRNKNEFEEANRLEQNAYLNLGIKALRTDSLDEYKEKLEAIVSNDNFSDETKQNVSKILLDLPKLEEIRNRHGNRLNYDTIVDKSINNIIYEKSKAEINTKINELRKTGTDILDKVTKFEPGRLDVNIDDSIDTVTLDDIQNADMSQMTREKVSVINGILAEHPELGQLVELNHVSDLYDRLNYENNKELKYELNPANQAEIRKRHIQDLAKNLIDTVNEKNVEEIKDQLETNGQLNGNTNSKINQKVEEKVVKDNSIPIDEINVKENDTVELDEPGVVDETSKLPQASKDSAANEFTKIVEDNPFDNALPDFIDEASDRTYNNMSDPDSAVKQANDNDALTLQPINLDDSSQQKKVIDEYTKVLNSLNNDINDNLKRNVKAEEAFGLFANTVGLQVAEQHFNMFKKAFENTEIDPNANWNSLYNKYFASLNKFNFGDTQIVPTPTTVAEATKSDQQANKSIAKTNTPVAYTQDNTGIKYLGRKISVAMNKIPFLGMKYKAVINPLDNTVTYVDDSDGLNTQGMANLNVILDPDVLVPGKTFNLQIPQDWRTRVISEWNKNEAGFMVQSNTTMQEWMDKNNIKESSQEWIDRVPMDLIIDGQNIGYGVHDTAWWNTRNVADFKDATIGDERITEEQAIQQQRSVIEQGREMTSAIRTAVFNGNTEMVITEREEGHTLTNKNNELRSLQNSNPDAQISIGSPSGFITNKGDNGNKYFKGQIVNEQDIDKGHAYMISRIGTTVINDEVVPTYVAHKVITNNDQSALNELAKSRQRIYDAANILNGTGNFKNPTEEQIVWAKNVKDQVRAMTGISIDNVSVSGNTIQYTGLGELKQLYPLTLTQYINDILNTPNLYTKKQFDWAKKAKSNNSTQLMLLIQMRNIEKQKLPIVHEDGSVTNYKSNAGEGYKAMLMDNLYTQKKFHTITDNNGNEKRVLDIQPRIKFDLKNKNATVAKSASAPLTQTAEPVVNEVQEQNPTPTNNVVEVTDLNTEINNLLNLSNESNITPQKLLSLLEQNNLLIKEC